MKVPHRWVSCRERKTFQGLEQCYPPKLAEFFVPELRDPGYMVYSKDSGVEPRSQSLVRSQKEVPNDDNNDSSEGHRGGRV